MKKLVAILGIVTFMTLVLSAGTFAQAQKPVEKPKPGATMQAAMARMNLRLEMRKLWTEHTVYHRNFIISTLADLGDVDAVTQRLLKNQDEIGNAIKPIYGDEAGTKLAALLRAHVMDAAEVVKAAKMGKTAELTAAQAKWKANADELAAFLSAANPNWPKATLQEMLYKHIENNTNEVVARLKKDWPADIAAFDADLAHMLNLADALTMGIQKQFPEKFRMGGPGR